MLTTLIIVAIIAIAGPAYLLQRIKKLKKELSGVLDFAASTSQRLNTLDVDTQSRFSAQSAIINRTREAVALMGDDVTKLKSDALTDRAVVQRFMDVVNAEMAAKKAVKKGAQKQPRKK